MARTKKIKMPPAFQNGGMLQEGGTVDPVSGNEVPLGSMQEEVRDDIPAQLSEGEFVFPADVVRFIGLERLMKMRQAAKEGLRQMEAMGQMGNSEEATMDDESEFETELDEIFSEIDNNR
jgi:Arc/MetJ-type ribon-helix-helix transcriptional regulator